MKRETSVRGGMQVNSREVKRVNLNLDELYEQALVSIQNVTNIKKKSLTE
jgi:hypothetical protein